MEITITSMDEHDTDRLLKLLYHGRKPERVHTLICACGAMGDLRQGEKAWNGWQIIPHAKCPACLRIQAPADGEAYPDLARKRFLNQLVPAFLASEETCKEKRGELV